MGVSKFKFSLLVGMVLLCMFLEIEIRWKYDGKGLGSRRVMSKLGVVSGERHWMEEFWKNKGIVMGDQNCIRVRLVGEKPIGEFWKIKGSFVHLETSLEEGQCNMHQKVAQIEILSYK